MKVLSTVQKLRAGNAVNLVISVPTKLADMVNKIKDDVVYSVKIENIRKKRSLDANAFAWLLCQQIAVKVGITKEEVYRRAIKECGNFTVIPIKEEAAERFGYIWSAHGLGWLTDVMGKCRKTEGYVNVLAYHGSSTYDTKEMSRFIDQLLFECKELGIDVISEKYRALLLEEWGKKEKK